MSVAHIEGVLKCPVVFISFQSQNMLIYLEMKRGHLHAIGLRFALVQWMSFQQARANQHNLYLWHKNRTSIQASTSNVSRCTFTVECLTSRRSGKETLRTSQAVVTNLRNKSNLYFSWVKNWSATPDLVIIDVQWGFPYLVTTRAFSSNATCPVTSGSS